MSEKRRQMLWMGLAAAAGLGSTVGWQLLQRKTQWGSAQLDALWSSEFETVTGETLTLKAYQGRPLVVNFWATWCPPCVAEMPLLDAFFRQNQTKRWQVVGLAIDQPSQVKRFLTQNEISYPVGLAGLHGPELMRQLGNEAGGLPFTVVLDEGGRLVQLKLGKLSEQEVKDWEKI